MRCHLTSFVSGALIVLAACNALGDVRPLPFYRVDITLISGQSIKGTSHGLAGFFRMRGASSRQVRSVQLSHASKGVVGHFTFSDNPEIETYVSPSEEVSWLELSVSTEYETINEQTGSVYYWIKQEVRVPIADILRIDTLGSIGEGLTVYADPRPYLRVEEPYLMVDDCGLGCPAKLYSEDKSLAKVELGDLWDKYLDCRYRSTPKAVSRMNEVMSEYRVKILIDPFCDD
jgi:hypothetical protein